MIPPPKNTGDLNPLARALYLGPIGFLRILMKVGIVAATLSMALQLNRTAEPSSDSAKTPKAEDKTGQEKVANKATGVSQNCDNKQKGTISLELESNRSSSAQPISYVMPIGSVNASPKDGVAADKQK